MFYTFDQNSSGGMFVVDENIAHYVIVEADSEESAITKAEGIGIYFDGVEMDCDCCGDRWYSPETATVSPEFDYFRLEGEKLVAKTYPEDFLGLTDPHAIVHFKDGRVIKITNKEVELARAEYKAAHADG